VSVTRRVRQAVCYWKCENRCLGYGKSHYDKEGGYKAFCDDFQRLREFSSPLTVSVKKMDIYLWVRGQWESYRTGKQSEVNKELAGIFERERTYLEEVFGPSTV